MIMSMPGAWKHQSPGEIRRGIDVGMGYRLVCRLAGGSGGHGCDIGIGKVFDLDITVGTIHRFAIAWGERHHRFDAASSTNGPGANATPDTNTIRGFRWAGILATPEIAAGIAPRRDILQALGPEKILLAYCPCKMLMTITTRQDLVRNAHKSSLRILPNEYDTSPIKWSPDACPV
jgi:hypothetical protein